MCKTSIFKNIFPLFLQLYIAKIPIGSGSGENFLALDPSKKGRIRLDPDSQPCRYRYLLPISLFSPSSRCRKPSCSVPGQRSCCTSSSWQGAPWSPPAGPGSSWTGRCRVARRLSIKIFNLINYCGEFGTIPVPILMSLLVTENRSLLDLDPKIIIPYPIPDPANNF